MHRLVPVPVRVAEPGELVRFDAALRAALDGSGPAVLPVADDGVPGGAGTGRTAAGKVAPLGPSSLASALVKPMTPALAAE